jgi:hypothetical protein
VALQSRLGPCAWACVQQQLLQPLLTSFRHEIKQQNTLLLRLAHPNAAVQLQGLVTAVLGLGTLNRVLYRLALVPLRDYVFFLAQAQNIGYLVIYYSLMFLRYRCAVLMWQVQQQRQQERKPCQEFKGRTLATWLCMKWLLLSLCYKCINI